MRRKTPPFSDIDLTHWKDYDHILTDSLWLFPQRDRSGGHQLDYHGNFIPQIATQVFTRYTRKNEVVIDWFLGSGTSAIEALRMDRRCIGIELKEDLIRYVERKLPSEALGKRIHLIAGDSRSPQVRELAWDTLAQWDEPEAHLAILHPPYHDIIRFSECPEDLSNAPTLETFLDDFEAVARNAYALLAPKRFAILVIGDKYSRGELIPLGFLCMQRMNAVGFRTKAICVKNIEGNERGKGKANNLWRYRALAGGYYIFKHEYVIIFQKPSQGGAIEIAEELQRLGHLEPWGRIQGDSWDRLSRFVYQTPRYGDLLVKAYRTAQEHHLDPAAFRAYVVRRWYNYHTHNLALDLLCAHPRVRRHHKTRDKEIDLLLRDDEDHWIPFDLKLTNLPSGWTLESAQANPTELVTYLYQEQSRGGRFHVANRLFLLVHDSHDPQRSWELRRDKELLSEAINAFLHAPQIFSLKVDDREGESHTPRTGILWAVR